MKQITSALLVLLSVWSMLSAQPRNILTGRYSRQSLAGIIEPAENFHPSPKAGQWNNLDEKIRDGQIKAAEKLLNTNWGEVKASVFMEYKVNGDRSNYEAISLTRRMNLNALVSAEMLENKGRFIADIVNGIWAICEESYWGVPATNNQKDTSGLPDITEPVIELFGAETAALLAWTQYLLKPQLDKVSPLICQRVSMEEDHRFFKPFAKRNDYWWMGYVDSTRKSSNWTPWIVSNYLATVLILEKNKAQRDSAIYRSIEILDNYLNFFPEDGSCDEGPAYWFRSAASLFDCLDLLDEASGGKINVKDVRLVRDMGAYVYKLYIGKHDYFANFADAIPRAGEGLDGGMIYRYGKYVQDTTMMKFGASIAREKGVIPNMPFAATIGRKLRSFRIAKEILAAPAAEPLIRDSWLPNLQVMTARSNANSIKGFYVAAIGGHNAESHNHNDVGSFMVYADAEPLLIDLGPEGYTAKTFGPKRYDIWTMQSQYHNLPTINGIMEKDGRQYAASEVKYAPTDKEAIFSLDISKAFPLEAKVAHWKRTITLKRNKSVNIREDYKLTGYLEPVKLNFMTNHSVDVTIPGKIVLNRDGHAFELIYDKNKYTAETENVFEDPSRKDSRIKEYWGKEVNRIILTGKQSRLSDSSEIIIRYVNTVNK